MPVLRYGADTIFKRQLKEGQQFTAEFFKLSWTSQSPYLYQRLDLEKKAEITAPPGWLQLLQIVIVPATTENCVMHKIQKTVDTHSDSSGDVINVVKGRIPVGMNWDQFRIIMGAKTVFGDTPYFNKYVAMYGYTKASKH